MKQVSPNRDAGSPEHVFSNVFPPAKKEMLCETNQEPMPFNANVPFDSCSTDSS